MNRFAFPFGLALTIAVGWLPSMSGAVETMTWQDLLPPRQLEIEQALTVEQRKLWAFAEAKRESYYDVAYELSLRTGLKDGSMAEADLTDEDRKILESKPSARIPAAVEYWQGIEKLRAQLTAAEKEVPVELGGRQVRIPGYVLPLEFSGDQVTEFLLVPYVGACIHAPAPPPNQIVHVRPAKPFLSDGMYAPVWIDGVLGIEVAKHDLSLVDGTQPVEVGYTMDAANVKPYTRD